MNWSDLDPEVRKVMMERREFLVSLGAATVLSGCHTCDFFGSPALRFGVISDIHLRTASGKPIAMLERAFRYFRSRRVDAVVIAGDLSDWGVRSGLEYLKSAWDNVFRGADAVPLFCTGNHDYDGWWYDDMAVEMYANGHSEREALVKLGLAEQWQEVFGEPFANVRCRTVKGYDFVSCEYGAKDGKELKCWFDANGGRLRRGRPFFFFQHVPIRGTTADSFGWSDNGVTKPILDAYPNCIAFTGHQHMPFTDERQIWQGEFTVLGTPSLSHAGFPKGHENGRSDRNGKATETMQAIPVRPDLRGGEGFVVNVWADKIVVERRDLEEGGEEGAPEWLIPLNADRPFASGVRESREPVPEFPDGARLDVETRNTENRRGHWAIVMNCEFPSAVVPSGHRVFDYEIRAVLADGTVALTKRFLSPAYAKMAKYEPRRQRFWFDVAELPKGRDYVVEVRARNCFERCSRPLVSDVWHGEPQPVKAKKS